MFTINLEWKEYKINLVPVSAWIKANAGEHYSGCSACYFLVLGFREEPSQEIKDSIQEYWDGLGADSDEATSYVSQAGLDAAKEAKKASGKAKLISLGLTEDEASALLG